jgi:hypothetical protein
LTPAAGALPPLPPGAKVRVVAPCPWNPPPNAQLSQQNLLLPTLGAAQEYVKPQLGPSQGTRAVAQDQANLSTEFGSLGMGWFDGVTVVIVEAVGDQAKLESHADALTKKVPRPDRLIVCPTAVSEARRAEITDDLNRRFLLAHVVEARFYGLSKAIDGKVLVRLRSDATPLAERLYGQYGDDISITLGLVYGPRKRRLTARRRANVAMFQPIRARRSRSNFRRLSW